MRRSSDCIRRHCIDRLELNSREWNRCCRRPSCRFHRLCRRGRRRRCCPRSRVRLHKCPLCRCRFRHCTGHLELSSRGQYQRCTHLNCKFHHPCRTVRRRRNYLRLREKPRMHLSCRCKHLRCTGRRGRNSRGQLRCCTHLSCRFHRRCRRARRRRSCPRWSELPRMRLSCRCRRRCCIAHLGLNSHEPCHRTRLRYKNPHLCRTSHRHNRHSSCILRRKRQKSDPCWAARGYEQLDSARRNRRP